MGGVRWVSVGERLLYRFKGRALKLSVAFGIGLSAAALIPALLSTEDRWRRVAAVAVLLAAWTLAEYLRRRRRWVFDVLLDRRWVLALALAMAIPYAIDGHAQTDAFMGVAPLAGVAAATCRRREVAVFALLSIIAYVLGVAVGGGGIGILITARHPFDGIQQAVSIAACCGLAAFVVFGFRRFIEAMSEFETHDNPPAALTKREREVLRMLGEGRSRDEIAGTLILATSTIRSHIDNARAKLEVRHQEEAVALYWRHHRDDE
jgi:DNA-binding CsgD family transcriptional regulator